jgi:hypothetical protein
MIFYDLPAHLSNTKDNITSCYHRSVKDNILMVIQSIHSCHIYFKTSCGYHATLTGQGEISLIKTS